MQYQMNDFVYDLPEGRIAQYPLRERDSSKLLIYKNGKILQDIYKNIDNYVPEGSLVVFNNTRVIPARLHFNNSTGAKIEIFCLEPAEVHSEPSSIMQQKENVNWKCLIGRVAKWKDKVITRRSQEFTLNAEILTKEEGFFIVKFSWHPSNFTFAEILDRMGEMPIPPYLKRESENIDINRYQTVYAKQRGSVAAPTAGLHFTERIFKNLQKRKVITDYVTLHVGTGTFLPVKTETIADHNMHSEWIEVKLESIEKILRHISQQTEKKIFVIGTTSLRTIESLYWMGVKADTNPDSDLHNLEIRQWDAYELQKELSAVDSLNSLLTWMRKNEIDKLFCKTQLLIVPSYQLKIANALVTNFHQPKSTLLLLVAALVGENWKQIYKYALDNNFRFLSYGDGCLLFDN
jgi:S-adenosylmethionine:tRNA ribosyltransferase-isomerase